MPDGMQQTSEGVLLAVKAQPGARRNGVAGWHGGALKVAVTAVAEKGKANREILRVLAEALEISPSKLGIISGETASRKMILISGETLAAVRSKLPPLDG